MNVHGYTIGLDFGTSSVRAVIADCRDGRLVAADVVDYPSGKQGVLLDPSDPNLARQNPADYLTVLHSSVVGALHKARSEPDFAPERIIGIGVDTTGSTPLPVDSTCQPLAVDHRWRQNLAAHAWLWKDHTSADEAAAITELAAQYAPHLLRPIGGTYSSEWFWAKIWRCLNVAPDVFEAAASWVELADFIPAVLTGVTNPADIKRCICAAGHKALYSDEWGGLPSTDFLRRLDAKLAGLRSRLFNRAYPADRPAGRLSANWARSLGLREAIPVAMGGFDAHYGAVGAGIRPGTLVKIIGTSTCDCALLPATGEPPEVPGICGIVNGSIMPGFYGIEAGQSAVGDLLKWWVEGICAGNSTLHEELSTAAANLEPGASGLVALDWNNGNRTVLVDSRLTGLLIGHTLHTTRAEIYRALIEATAFGARTIVERLQQYGVRIDRVVTCGGIADKNPLFLQIYADVLGYPMQVSDSPQTPALGAAISAAVAAGKSLGGYDGFEDAQSRMAATASATFVPDPKRQAVYNDLFNIYKELHDTLGGVASDSTHLRTTMKRLLALRDGVTSDRQLVGDASR